MISSIHSCDWGDKMTKWRKCYGGSSVLQAVFAWCVVILDVSAACGCIGWVLNCCCWATAVHRVGNTCRRNTASKCMVEILCNPHNFLQSELVPYGLQKLYFIVKDHWKSIIWSEKFDQYRCGIDASSLPTRTPRTNISLVHFSQNGELHSH